MRGMATRGKRLTTTGLALAVVTVTLILLISGVASAAPPWSDAPNAWWIGTYGINESQAASVADGWPDGTFRPNLDVTRAQFAKMATAGLGVPTAYPVVASFPDVPPSNFFYPWIEGGVKAGLIAGLNDGTFGPDQSIIRQQSNSILGNYLAQRELTLRGHIAGRTANYPSLNTWYLAEGQSILAQFADANRVAGVHAPATAYLIYRGVVQGSYNNGWMYLGPSLELTRGQAVALILRVKAVTFSTALPTVTNLNPATGLPSGGNSVVITGTNFTDVFAVKFGSAAASFVVNSATQITAIAPAGSLGSTVDVRVETAAGTSATGTASKYTYGLPTLTGLNPASGPTQGGNTVIITGTNLSGATAVKFGTKPANSFNVVSSTQITAIAPSGAGTVDVTVTAPGGTTATSAASKYSYGLPTVTGLTPTQGPAIGGTSVTITGTGFSGVSAVKFGTKAATSFVINSPTSITAVSPTWVPGVVDVTVTTAAGTSVTGSTSKFTFTGPVITLLNPAAGPLAGGNTVVITGTGFTNVTSVKFGGQAANFIVDSPTQIRAAAPQVTASGTVDVVVTTTSGSSATSDATKYTYGAPVITKLDPSWGPAAGTNDVQIYGTGFINVTAVKFGNQSVAFHWYSNTHLSATAPAGVNGSTVQVTVTANGATSSTSGTANDYHYGAPIFAVTRAGTNTPLTGLTRTAGVPYAVRVTAQDSQGHTIEDFNGTVSLTSNAWNGSVTVNLVEGAADNVVITPKIAGTLRYISVTFGTSTTTNASGNFTVVPGAVQKLQVLLPGETADQTQVNGKSGTPTHQVVGTPFSVVVNAVDAYWNLVTSVNDNISLNSTNVTATLPVGASLTSGTGTFSVTFNAAGTWTITASDTSHPTVASGTSAAVVASSTAHLVIVVPGETVAAGSSPGKTGTPTARTAGQSFNVDVYAMDAAWNIIATSTDTIRITTTCPSRSLPSDADLVAGHRQFSVILNTRGSWTITATDLDTGLTATSPSIAVNAAALDHFGWGAITGTKTAGTPFTVTLTAYDAYNNIKTDYAGTPALTASNGGPVTPAAPAPGEWSNGVWTHSVTLTLTGTGITLNAEDSPADNDSGAFTVAAGAPANVSEWSWRLHTFGTWSSLDPVSALTNLARVDLRMKLVDAYGNVVASKNVSTSHPLYRYVETAPGSATGSSAPASSTTDSNGYIYWNNVGGWSNTTRELYTGLDLDGQGDADEIGLWYHFTMTWGTP